MLSVSAAHALPCYPWSGGAEVQDLRPSNMESLVPAGILGLGNHSRMFVHTAHHIDSQLDSMKL